MKIISTQYTLSTKSLDIFVSGCNLPHCKNCCNPESWDFNIGDIFDDNFKIKIDKKINTFNNIIKNVMILGGEPLDQKINSIISLLQFIRQYDVKIWLFTKYDISKISYDIKNLCNYIKCGRYDENKKTNNNIQFGISLASSNQTIYKIN